MIQIRLAHRHKMMLPIIVAASVAVSSSHADVIRVGPQQTYSWPSEAAQVARSGDIVEIEAADYRGDVSVWRQDDLTLMGIGGRPHLIADGENAEGKALWVIKGRNTRVESIEFSGATVPDRNGAGIRQEGVNLIIKNCYFHHNQNGLLAGSNAESEILILNSEFAHNGSGDGLTHNIYVGDIAKLTILNSYIHHARVGHQIKSRARETIVRYNRLMDEHSGNSSYIIDVSNGGLAVIVGNLIQQGQMAENWAVLSYAAEGSGGRAGALYVVNNTFVNERDRGIFVNAVRSARPAVLINNLFLGAGTMIRGPAEPAANLTRHSAGLRSVSQFDYRLTADSPAVDAGREPSVVDGIDLRPDFQYVHVASSESRPVWGALDIGAYEYVPETTDDIGQ